MNEGITVTTADGSFGAYVARPAASPAPAVVVIQEIFGINADMRAHCDELAAKGYLAVCPDLFWRLEPGVELTDQSPGEWARAMALYKAFDIDKGVEDVAATLAAARALPGAGAKAGLIGYCAGGLLSFLTAARVGADAAVAYYGGGTDKYLAQLKHLRTPLMMHLAEADEFIPKQARDAIVDAAKALPHVEIYIYPGQNHAFARTNGKHYNAEAASLARQRSVAFFDKHLRS